MQKGVSLERMDYPFGHRPQPAWNEVLPTLEETLEKACENRSLFDPLPGFLARPLVRPFRVATGEAHFWTLEDNLKESEIQKLRF